MSEQRRGEPKPSPNKKNKKNIKCDQDSTTAEKHYEPCSSCFAPTLFLLVLPRFHRFNSILNDADAVVILLQALKKCDYKCCFVDGIVAGANGSAAVLAAAVLAAALANDCIRRLVPKHATTEEAACLASHFFPNTRNLRLVYYAHLEKQFFRLCSHDLRLSQLGLHLLQRCIPKINLMLNI